MKRVIVILFVLALSCNMNAQNIDVNKIDSFIKNVENKLKLKTGLSVGIVIGNKKVFSKGFGFVNIQKKIPATSDSPFYIASSTKSFTAALVELLTEKDTLNIDVPLTKYLPGYEFENENLHADLISLRDLLTHRSGILNLPVVIRTAYTGQHTNKKLLELYSSSSQFTTSQFKYGNDGYVFTSLILDSLYNKPWQELMKEKLFIPLNMKNTSCKISDYDSDMLKAYATKNGKVEELQFIKGDNTMHAAGGIVSTTSDLCNWLLFNINNGTFNGKEILSKRKMDEMHSSQEGCSVTFWEYKRYAYGLGWYLSDYNGEELIHHSGGYAGARSHISFMPDYNIGVVSLTNDDEDGYYVVDLIADYIYNLYLGKDADKIAEEELAKITSDIEKNNENESNEEEAKVESAYNENKLVGKYINDEYGKIEISNIDGLLIKFGNMNGQLNPSTKTQFRAMLGPFNTKIEFTKEKDEIIQLVFHGPIKIIFNKI